MIPWIFPVLLVIGGTVVGFVAVAKFISLLGIPMRCDDIESDANYE